MIAYMITRLAGPVAGPAVAFVPTLFFALLKLGMLIEWILPDRLTLGESAMRCDPYDPKQTLMRKSRRWVRRSDLVAVRLVWLTPEPKSRPRRYLECDCGTEPVLIARDLRDCDLEWQWLAAVLWTWAAERAVPAARVNGVEDVRA